MIVWGPPNISWRKIQERAFTQAYLDNADVIRIKFLFASKSPGIF